MARVRTITPDGEEIKLRRQMAGLTQEDLGKLVSRTRQTICDAENGRRPVSLLVVGRIAKVFKVNTEKLLKQDIAA